MSPLHVAAVGYFGVLHPVIERSSHRRWSIMFYKISQNSLENIFPGVSTYEFISQSMGRPDKRRSCHWRCSVKKGVVNLANCTGNHLCWTLFLIKLQKIKPATLLKLNSNRDVSCEICKIFKNTYFEECFYKRQAARNLRFCWVRKTNLIY